MSAHPQPLRVEKHKHSRFWAVRDAADGLVVVAAYRQGAEHVAHLLAPGKTKPEEFHRLTV